jgi:methylisocitrate lyase
MLRLDHNRALSQLAAEGRRGRGRHREADGVGQPLADHVSGLPLRHRQRRIAEGQDQRRRLEPRTFIPKVGKRGAAIIEARGLSSAASAANAAIDHIRDWVLGTNGKWVTMGIPSDGSYGIPEDVMYGVPVTCANGEYTRIEGLPVDDYSRADDGQDAGRTRRRACRRRASALTAFRTAVAAEQPLQVMGAITAYAGLMAKRTGYKALYLSGGGVAANSLGIPDLGISTMEDVLTDARRIVDATRMPLLVDIDTGWGGAFNIGRTIRSFINIGVAAVHMEDQVGQKRCGHRPGKEVVTKDEMIDRIKAAVDARTDPGFVIMARTDAAAVEGLESAIDRAAAYVEAGADMVFPEAMKTLDDYRRVKAAVKVPILANLTEFGSTPFYTTDELREAGVDIALYCCGAYRAMNKAALHFYETVRREGTQKNIIDTLQTRAELYDFLEYHSYEDKLDALFAKKK